MFRCTTSPTEPTFPSTLSGLNMTLDPTSSQAVDKTTGAPFTYFISSSARVNDLHKEAFQTAMRSEMKRTLAEEFGISEHFIIANDTAAVVTEKPTTRHIPVLMSDGKTLRRSRDVIVVVGESGQDCGVLAWRLVRGKEGLRRGTVVGVAEGVKEYALEQGLDEVPAMIVLNPGQRYYSYRDNCAKTLVSWNDGVREDAMQEFPAEIDEVNLLEGHETAGEHIHTFLEKILPGMIDTNARLYFIVIGDAVEHVLTALNKRLDDKTVPPQLSRQVEAVTLVCPHIATPKDQFNAKMKYHLVSEAKSWVNSSLPLGEIVASPLHDISAPSEEQKIGDDDIGEEAGSEEEGKEEAVTEEESPMVVTFSTGKEDDGITETALDSCLGEVLKFVWKRREEVVEQQATYRRFAVERMMEESDKVLADGWKTEVDHSSDH